MPNLSLPFAALLGLGAAAILAAALLLSRPSGSPERFLARAAFVLRQCLARLLRNPPEAWYRWGLQAADPDLAVAFLEEAARLGHQEAHFELGLFYEEGGQGPGGRDRAARHYQAAADQGHPEAAFRLAELLRWGIGPARDPGAALRWYERSALGGFRPAADWLVRAFEFGEGAEEDLEKAVAWTLKARALAPGGIRISHFARKRPWSPDPGGAPPAPGGPGPEAETFFRLGMAFLGGTRAGDPLAARLWLERAAQAGHVEAMAQLGALLAGGEAHPWLERAEAAGHLGAQVRLGRLPR